MESTGFHQAHYKSTHIQCAIYQSKRHVNFFHTQIMNVFLLIKILKNIFLQSGLIDMTTSCFNCRLLHIALCDFSVAVAVVAR